MQSVNKITPVLIPTRAYICAECGGYVHTHNVCVGAGHSYGMMLRSVEALSSSFFIFCEKRVVQFSCVAMFIYVRKFKSFHLIASRVRHNKHDLTKCRV